MAPRTELPGNCSRMPASVLGLLPTFPAPLRWGRCCLALGAKAQGCKPQNPGGCGLYSRQAESGLRSARPHTSGDAPQYGRTARTNPATGPQGQEVLWLARRSSRQDLQPPELS
jgi:hypothetical protein